MAAKARRQPMSYSLRSAVLAEKFVLAYLLGPWESATDDIMAILPSWQYFTENLHRWIYQRMRSLYEAGEAITLETVMPGDGDKYSFGDVAGVVTTDFTLDDYYPDLRFKKRALTAARVVADCYHRQLIADTVDNADIEDLSSYIQKLTNIGSARHLDIRALTSAALDRLDELESDKTPYPYPLFQKLLQGIEQGSYTIIAARPSTGKSVMIQDFIFSALRDKRRVLFLSAEMPQRMLEHRLLCAVLGKNLSQLKKLWHVERYNQLVAQGLAELDTFDGFHIVFSNRVSEIEERLKQEPYDLVVVDYLQMLEPKRQSYRGDYEKVTSVSAELVAMARAYNTAFIVAAQFNRDGNDKQPSMADLKGSGQIEQDADLIFSLWRDETDTAPAGERMIRVDCLKNRNGAVWKNGTKRFALLMEEGIYRFKSVTGN